MAAWGSHSPQAGWRLGPPWAAPSLDRRKPRRRREPLCGWSRAVLGAPQSSESHRAQPVVLGGCWGGVPNVSSLITETGSLWVGRTGWSWSPCSLTPLVFYLKPLCMSIFDSSRVIKLHCNNSCHVGEIPENYLDISNTN